MVVPTTRNVMNKIKFLFGLMLSILFASIIFSECNSSVKVNEKSVDSVLTQSSDSKKKLITVKYRSDPVDIGSSTFEYLSTSSSFVNGAWYDQYNKYMIIKLKSTYYHYCSFPLSEWKSFMSADSYGTYYNKNIKGNYDCRKGYVPSYK